MEKEPPVMSSTFARLGWPARLMITGPVIARVALPATAGPQLVLVVNDGNASIDSFLDSESDRRVESTGRLSLGPLAPGAYVIELHGAGGRRSERIRIIDRDVYATFR